MEFYNIICCYRLLESLQDYVYSKKWQDYCYSKEKINLLLKLRTELKFKQRINPNSLILPYINSKKQEGDK
ncbi:hypothetical protein EO92_18445 [Methanosarcina sp. 2.H.A.1B.4]|nr:hypothetical protein EO92_18445 [Methanosarcina sp. 2.H.A.1B.4]